MIRLEPPPIKTDIVDKSGLTFPWQKWFTTLQLKMSELITLFTNITELTITDPSNSNLLYKISIEDQKLYIKKSTDKGATWSPKVSWQ